jgi:riboflavin biosynthesis pyrimidine reductase
MSMDGRIADRSGSLAFLDVIGDDVPSDEFESLLTSTDAIVVGASTLRWLLDGGHGWPHGDIATWLVSHDESLVASVGATTAPFRRVEGDVAGIFEAVEASGAARVWLAGGGDLAGQALACDRVDEVVATVAPSVVGAGPALFDHGALAPRAWRLEEARPWGGGAARLRWRRT